MNACAFLFLTNKTKCDMSSSEIKPYVTNIKEFAPITPDDWFWEKLFFILHDVENWEWEQSCSRNQFEIELINNKELADKYIELYSEDSRFAILPFGVDNGSDKKWYEFFLMINNKGMTVLTFYKESDTDYDF